MESKKTIAWWRYPAAVILLAMCSIFLPVVISVVMGLMQIITPRFFQSGFGWIVLVADIAGVAIGFLVADHILQESQYVFQAVLAAIEGAIFVFVALYNWKVFGVATDSDLFGCIGVLGAAVTSFVFVGLYCKKNAKQQQNKKQE